MSSKHLAPQSDIGAQSCSGLYDAPCERRWYAVFTVPQNEKSVVRHLTLRDVESFLPTYEGIRVWKNRQRIKTDLALFPSYLFVKVDRGERVKVLQAPGVLHIVGNGHQPLPLEEAEIDFLRVAFLDRKVEPYKDLVVGEKVRVKTGVLQGIEGTLVRKNSYLRFILTLNLINQHAAIEVDADTLEAVPTKV
jgi:transcription antitermination factor NusG